MPNLQEFLTIKEAAEFLGVTPNTLRNWGMAGKVAEYRNPVNNYRLYKPKDLKRLLERIELTPQGKRSNPNRRKPK